MATPKSQRVFLWVIVIVLAVGTIGGYYSVVVANDQAQQQAQAEQTAEQQQNDAVKQAAKANQPLDGYSADPFTASDVTTLQKTDLVEGTGDTVQAGAKIHVSYFGWTPDGTIFDSTTKNGTNTPTAQAFTLDTSNLIQGWVDGIPGMKVGGVRKLMIPAAQAYGANGMAPLISANTPLAFVIRVESIEK